MQITLNQHQWTVGWALVGHLKSEQYELLYGDKQFAGLPDIRSTLIVAIKEYIDFLEEILPPVPPRKLKGE